MKNLELILEAVDNISNDKLVEAVAFSLRMEAVKDFIICAGLIIVVCFAIYSFTNSFNKSC